MLHGGGDIGVGLCRVSRSLAKRVIFTVAVYQATQGRPEEVMAAPACEPWVVH